MEKFALITGSSSGLGFEMTRSLIEQGYTVFGGSRSGTDIEHDNFYDVELDITSEESVLEFYATIREFTDKIHLVVNNAGVYEMKSMRETSLDRFEDLLATNTVGPFLLFKYLEGFLIQGETHIISILSTAAHYGYPNNSAYSASKFGQLGLIESLKKEWRTHKIRFTNLLPGAINTPLWDKVGASFSRDKMLKVDEFMSVFDFVVNAPETIQFPELTFLHREGFFGMNSRFLISKRKTFELLALVLFNIITYFLWSSFKFNTLFSFGFIWNWVASQEKDIMIANSRRYRFSTLKFVFGFQNFVYRHTEKLPLIVRFIVKILPAGIFWLFIIFMNDSEMPWWSVFLGSLCAELIQFDPMLKKENRDQIL